MLVHKISIKASSVFYRFRQGPDEPFCSHRLRSVSFTSSRLLLCGLRSSHRRVSRSFRNGQMELGNFKERCVQLQSSLTNTKGRMSKERFRHNTWDPNSQLSYEFQTVNGSFFSGRMSCMFHHWYSYGLVSIGLSMHVVAVDRLCKHGKYMHVVLVQGWCDVVIITDRSTEFQVRERRATSCFGMVSSYHQYRCQAAV